jgi:hypothetical protein
MPYVEFVLHLEAHALDRLQFADNVALALFGDDAHITMLRLSLREIAGA